MRGARRAGLRLLGTAVLVAAALAGCHGERPQVHREVFIALGQVFEVRFTNASEEQTRQAVAALADDLDYMDRSYLPQRAGALRRINQLLELEGWFSVNPSILPLIVEAQALSGASGGLFNPAAGRLNRLWGLQGDAPDNGKRPTPEAIARVVSARPAMTDIEIEGIRVRSNNAAVQLDFGPFVAGYALDRLGERLRGLDVANVTLATETALRTVQVEEAYRPWYDITAAGDALARVRLGASEAACTLRRSGRGAAPRVIDPRSGQPAPGMAAVVVLHPSAALAAAGSSALFVAGAQGWREAARAMGIEQALVVSDDGALEATAALQARLQPAVQGPAPAGR